MDVCVQLCCSRANFGPLPRGQPYFINHYILLCNFRQDHREPRNEVGSVSPSDHPLVVYKNALNDSVILSKKILKSNKARFHLV